jgi:hypothetical protein
MVSLGQLSTPCRGSSRGAVVLGGQGVCEAREPPLSFWHAALCESQSILSHFCATSKAHVHQLSVCMPPAVILASAHARDARGRGPVLISSALLRTCTHTRCGQTAGMVPMVGVLYDMYPPPHMTCILLLIWANGRNGADGRSPGQDLRQQSAQDVQVSQGRGATSVPTSCTCTVHTCVASARCTCGPACFIPMQHRTVFSAASKGLGA